jgi:hypothetical protein
MLVRSSPRNDITSEEIAVVVKHATSITTAKTITDFFIVLSIILSI